MRLIFEHMGLNHIYDTIDDSPAEAVRFRQAVVDSYVNISAGDYQRHGPIMENSPRRWEREGRWVAADSRNLGASLAGTKNPQRGIKND